MRQGSTCLAHPAWFSTKRGGTSTSSHPARATAPGGRWARGRGRGSEARRGSSREDPSWGGWPVLMRIGAQKQALSGKKHDGWRSDGDGSVQCSVPVKGGSICWEAAATRAIDSNSTFLCFCSLAGVARWWCGLHL